MRAEDDGFGQDALAQLPANARCNVIRFQPSNNAVSDVVEHRLVAVKNRAGVHGQIFHAHLRGFVQNHVQHIVAVAQMMMERNGHTVPQAGLFHCLPECFAELTQGNPPPQFQMLLPMSYEHAARWGHLSSCPAEQSRPCPSA